MEIGLVMGAKAIFGRRVLEDVIIEHLNSGRRECFAWDSDVMRWAPYFVSTWVELEPGNVTGLEKNLYGKTTYENDAGRTHRSKLFQIVQTANSLMC